VKSELVLSGVSVNAMARDFPHLVTEHEPVYRGHLSMGALRVRGGTYGGSILKKGETTVRYSWTEKSASATETVREISGTEYVRGVLYRQLMCDLSRRGVRTKGTSK